MQTILDHLIDLKKDGSFRLNLRYFNYCTGLSMFNARFSALFGQPARQPEAPISSFYADIAASVQQITEMVVLRMAGLLLQNFR